MLDIEKYEVQNMNIVRRVLCILAIISLYLTAGNALAAVAHPVCSTSDFMEFITKYANLTAQEQFSCVQLPFINEKKKYTSINALFKARRGCKLIYSSKDFSPSYRAWTPLFVPGGTDFPDDNNAPGHNDLVYFITKGDKKGTATLTEGGTHIMELIVFIRKNNVWWADTRIVDIYGM